MSNKDLSQEHIVSLLRKDNRKYQLLLLLCLIAIVSLAFSINYLKEPQVRIIRLYKDVESNETIIVDDTLDNKIRQTDISFLVKYIVDHFDLKSTNALTNFNNLQNISDGDFLKELQSYKEPLITRLKISVIDKVFNTIDTTTFKFNKDSKLFVATINYSQYIIYKDGKTERFKKEVKLGLKPVNRNEYLHDLNLGGWYFGLMLHKVSLPVTDI